MKIRQKVQRQVKLGQVDQNIWSAITVDPQLHQQLRGLKFDEIDDLGVLRWLLKQGKDFRCSFGWYTITRRGLEYMANRANAPIELIALTSAIFSTRTAVDLNILATNLWDIEPDNIWVYSRFRPDIPKGNIKKFLKMRQNWEELTDKLSSVDKSELAKVWTFALTRPNWVEIVQDELPSVNWLTADAVETINSLAKPITMYGKTGNYALNLLGYTGVITVDTHMFKPIFGTNGISDDLATLIHKDKELYQSFSEDYTDILEDLASELDIRSQLGFEPTPAGLQAVIWVVRQVAGQDFTKPVGFSHFHRFRDALASDYFNPPKTGRSKSKLEHIITYLEDMYNNPKGTKGFTDEEVQRWQTALLDGWIRPLKNFKEELDTLKQRGEAYQSHQDKIREPKRIFSVSELIDDETELLRSPEQMIEEVHKTKTKERTLLGEIQPILETELLKLAKELGFDHNHIYTTIKDVALASVKAQEAVHISAEGSSLRNQQIRMAGQRYQQSKSVILSLLTKAQNQNLKMSPELFLAFLDTKKRTAILHPFWQRMFPEGRLEVQPGGVVEVVLPSDEGQTIRLQLDTIATQRNNQWFMPNKYRIKT